MAHKKRLAANPPTLNKHIGLSIKTHRKHAKLTQAELGRHVGTSQQIVAAIEQGLSKQSAFIPPICRVLGLDIETTMFTDEIPCLVSPDQPSLSEEELAQLEQRFSKVLRVLGELNEIQHKPFLPQEDLPNAVELLIQQVRELINTPKK